VRSAASDHDEQGDDDRGPPRNGEQDLDERPRVDATPDWKKHRLTYLSFNALSEGVGASQVLPYVEGLARRGVRVTLHTFEKEAPASSIEGRLGAVGVEWVRHDLGRSGVAGGFFRVLRAASAIRSSPLVHARGDLAAAAAELARVPMWVWDMRSFWAEQRIDEGTLRFGSPEERALRLVTSRAAKTASAVIVLSHAAQSVLGDRFGAGITEKSAVVPTCVDLNRFRAQPMPPWPPVRVLLAGTLNARYDVPAMLRFVEHLRSRAPVELVVLAPGRSHWDNELRRAADVMESVSPGEMPGRIAACHVGLSIMKPSPTSATRGAMPTKLGEFFALGRPVVVSGEIGDMAALLERSRAGAILRGTSDAELAGAARRIESLLSEPETPADCRRLAEEHFDLEHGLDTLMDMYGKLVTTGTYEKRRTRP
jgi:hypothetical protein